MAAVTTRNGQKPFAWSYSKIKNFESCARRYFQVDVAKTYKEEDSEQLKWGNAVHKALAERIEKNVPLPKGMEEFEKYAIKVTSGGNAQILVEQKLAITADFAPCEWFARNAWYRGIGDVIKIVSDVALVADWKTGKIVEDSVQLALMAQCVFSHHPQVQRVRSVFFWLKEDADTTEDFAREDMVPLWNMVLPRVDRLRIAHETMTFPPKPGPLCRKWCPDVSCPHHGK
jgi:hypothetical protein